MYGNRQKEKKIQEDSNVSTKISFKLKQKVVSPLGTKTHATVFSSVYTKGGIPCRLIHGSVRHKVGHYFILDTLEYRCDET